MNLKNSKNKSSRISTDFSAIFQLINIICKSHMNSSNQKS